MKGMRKAGKSYIEFGLYKRKWSNFRGPVAAVYWIFIFRSGRQAGWLMFRLLAAFVTWISQVLLMKSEERHIHLHFHPCDPCTPHCSKIQTQTSVLLHIQPPQACIACQSIIISASQLQTWRRSYTHGRQHGYFMKDLGFIIRSVLCISF